MNRSRIKRGIVFGIALAVGFTLYDWVALQELNISRTIISGIAGGAVYALMLKIQGR